MAEYRAAATHPQSPASPLPEAAEPVGDPFAYLIRRLEANTAPAEKFLPGCRVVLMDQARAFIGATRFEAQAPAQAGEVFSDTQIEALYQAMSRAGYGLPSGSEERRKSMIRGFRTTLATLPLAAPVQQEAEAVAILPMNERLAPIPPSAADWCSQPPVPCAFSRDWAIGWDACRNWVTLEAKLYATPPAHPVLAPVVREPLTQEQIAALKMVLHHYGSDSRTQCLKPLIALTEQKEGGL